MIIIGLLVGGVLKGQELITNAKVTATIDQVNKIDAAVASFRDMHRAYPGDMTLPGAQLPSCTGLGGCNIPGDGNGVLSNSGEDGPDAGEGQRFFIHLAAANLIGGIDPTLPATSWGAKHLSLPTGGGVYAARDAGVLVDSPCTPAQSSPAGHYLKYVEEPGQTYGTPLTPNVAQRIDTKMDDGAPCGGRIIGVLGGGPNSCATNLAYNETTTTPACGMFIRLLQ